MRKFFSVLVLKDCTFSFSRFWKFSAFVLLNMFLMPLACTASFLPVIHRFGLLMVSQRFRMFICTSLGFFFFSSLHLHFLPHLSHLQALIVCLEFDPAYWKDFQFFFFFSYFILLLGARHLSFLSSFKDENQTDTTCTFVMKLNFKSF
jgi:hypothetical protein